MDRQNPVRRILLLTLSLDIPLTVLTVAALVRLLRVGSPDSTELVALTGIFYPARTVLFIGMVARALGPFVRWEGSSGRHAPSLEAAHAAVARAPLLLSVVFSILWGLSIIGALVILEVLNEGVLIENYVLPAVALFLLAVLLGSFSGAYVVHSWTLSSEVARVSAAAGKRCGSLAGSDLSWRGRLVILLYVAILTPSAWIGSFGYLAEMRSMVRSASRRAEAVARVVAQQVTMDQPGAGPEMILRRYHSEKVTPFIASSDGEVLLAATDGARFDPRVDPLLREKAAGRARGSWFDQKDLRVVAFERTAQADLAVVAVDVKHPAAGEFASASLVFGVVVLLWGLLVTHFLSTQLSQQIKRVSDVVGAVGRAETPRGAPRVPLYDHHEMGSLAESINRMLDRLERSEEAALEMERFKDEFIRMAAHELKTPVTIVKGYAQLLQSPANESAREHSVTAILRGTERMSHIVSELVDICRIRAGRYVIRSERINLNELVSEVASHAARQSGRTIRMLQGEHATVEGDRTRLAEVCAVIIDNAITYSPPEATVEVDVVRVGEQAVLSVEDHGIGIPLEKRPLILEPFRRAHADTPHDRGGVGVALYLSRLIVERHGGRIWFESEEGRGTKFHVALPAAKEDFNHANTRSAQDNIDHRG